MKCCVTIVTTCFQFCLLFCPILWHNSCSVQFIRGEDQMSKLHRLGSDFLPHLPNYHHQQIMQGAQNTKLSKYQISSTKLSPVANTAGCTKYQIITGEKLKHLQMGRIFSWGRFHNMRHLFTINLEYLADIEHSSPQLIHMPLKVGPSKALKIWAPQTPKGALKTRPPKTVKPSRVAEIEASRQLHALLETPSLGHFSSPHNI